MNLPILIAIWSVCMFVAVGAAVLISGDHPIGDEQPPKDDAGGDA